MLLKFIWLEKHDSIGISYNKTLPQKKKFINFIGNKDCHVMRRRHACQGGYQRDTGKIDLFFCK